MAARVALLLLAVLLVACAPGANVPRQRPADWSFRYTWAAGSMPPPYHYEFTITVDAAGQGEIIYLPNYPADLTPVWREQFSPTPAALDELYAALRRAGMFTRTWRVLADPPIGGSTQTLQVSMGEQVYEAPAQAEGEEQLAEVYERIRALPPEEVWQSLEARREAYMADYEE